MLCTALLISVALVACSSGDSNDDGDTKDDEIIENREESEDGNTEENADADEGNTDSDNEAAEETGFDFDPNGENIVTLQLEQEGTIVRLTFKAKGDLVYEQSANNEKHYSALGVSSAEEAKEKLASSASEFEDIEGVTHSLEYLDDRVIESLTVDFEKVDLNAASQLTGSGDLSDGVSLQQSVQTLQEQGYEIVESDTNE